MGLAVLGGAPTLLDASTAVLGPKGDQEHPTARGEPPSRPTRCVAARSEAPMARVVPLSALRGRPRCFRVFRQVDCCERRMAKPTTTSSSADQSSGGTSRCWP